MLKRFLREDAGQNIVEYTLMIGLVCLIIWVAVKATGVDTSVTNIWKAVNTQLGVSSGS